MLNDSPAEKHFLRPEDVAGAIIEGPFSCASVAQLKRWLKCHGASTGGLKKALVER